MGKSSGAMPRCPVVPSASSSTAISFTEVAVFFCAHGGKYAEIEPHRQPLLNRQAFVCFPWLLREAQSRHSGQLIAVGGTRLTVQKSDCGPFALP